MYYCSAVCGYHRRPQILAEICKNMVICRGFRAVAARGKCPGSYYWQSMPLPSMVCQATGSTAPRNASIVTHLQNQEIQSYWILTHWSRDNMAAISQTTPSKAFLWVKMLEFRFNLSLKFVTQGLINKVTTLVQIMAWRRPGNKPLSELRPLSFLTHICVTRPQCVNTVRQNDCYFTDDIFKRIFINEKCCILIQISLCFLQLAMSQKSFR